MKCNKAAVMVTRRMNNPTAILMNEATRLLLYAIIVRLCFIVVGTCFDGQSTGPRYTDIDYNVFSDAAQYVADGDSPYERPTYRYPPIVALLLTGNAWFGAFGKLLFSMADALCALELLFCDTFLGYADASTLAWLWAFNLPSINICTRGSADSLTNYLVLLLVRLTVQLRDPSGSITVLVAALFGTLVYLRIYPVIYGPAILINLLARASCKQKWEDTDDFIWRVFLCTVKFIVTAGAVLYLLCSISYYYYGEPYLQHALLYHLSREDHRHNFSVHFLGTYLSKGTTHSYGELMVRVLTKALGFDTAASTMGEDDAVASLAALVASKLVLFAPQLLLFMFIVAVYAPRNLPVCLLLQTMVFVAYNKVITAQYFTWYLCLLPLSVPSLRHIPIKVAAASALVWVGALLYWLYQAYTLEFEGHDRFVAVWQASMWFHWANVVSIAVIVYYAPLSAPASTS